MDEKEAEARPVMGTIFLVKYYVKSVFLKLLCIIWGPVFSHVVASVLQTYTTLRMCDISWASQYGEHIPELAMKFLKASQWRRPSEDDQN